MISNKSIKYNFMRKKNAKFLVRFFVVFFLSIIYCIIKLPIFINSKNTIKKIGVLSYTNGNNIGNILVKYSMYLLLKSFGLDPTIIAPSLSCNLYFLHKYIKNKEITNFSEIKETDYDILMVNSDQTWNKKYRYLLNIGFLYFARNWSIPKFVYGASLGSHKWNVPKKVLNKAQTLVKNFTAVSVREQNSIEIIHHYLGVKPVYVLDPTFLINKNEYIKLIKDYKLDINLDEDYLCVYKLDKNIIIENFINEVCSKFNMKILYIDRFKPNYIENFLYSINISKAMITDSYHGTVFSIIFNKPFISFINSKRGRDRFFSLNKTFNLGKRIVFPAESENIEIDLLKEKPIINESSINLLKEKSLNYLKKNLGILNG